MLRLPQMSDGDAKFQALLEAAPDAIVIVDRAGTIQLVNAEAERLFGYTRDELLGRGIETLVPERYRSDHVAHRARYQTAARTRPMGAGYDLFARRKDGSEFPVEISLSPVVTEDGPATISAIRDITDRKRADEKFRALLESAPDAMVIVDADGVIVLVNAQAERMFGFRREELLGRPVEVLVPEPARAAHRQHRRTYFGVAHARPMGAGLELEGERKDGTRFPVEISLSPLQTEAGPLVASAIRDMTDRRQADDERRRLLHEREAHREANRIKDEFLATLSHELRTPLNAILGWTTLLQKGGLDAAAAGRALGTIERNARAQVQLIEDLLDVSRVVTGKLRLQMQPIDITTVVEHAVDVVQPAAAAKGLALTFVCEHRPILLIGDPDRLQQAVWNLASNAVKFSDRGRVEVTVRLAERTVSIAVRDTGRGIRPEFIPHMFDRFRQADSSYTREYGGLGIGLAIARSVVELHGGTIRAHSSGPGFGALFVVDLPLPQGVDRGLLPRSGDESDLAVADALQGVRVLVVDDQADERELLSTILQAQGAAVTVASSVRDAIAAMAGSPPDVLVSDIAMPGEDGYSLIRQLRDRPETAAIPAIAVTAHARAEDREHALSAGFRLYVPKPVDPTRLVRTVANLARARIRG